MAVGPAESVADDCDLARLRVLVVGTGLIGTSIGMALRRRGTQVLLTDRNHQRVALAVYRGAGRPLWPGGHDAPSGLDRKPVALTYPDTPERSNGSLANGSPVSGSAMRDARESGLRDVALGEAARDGRIDHVVLAVPPREVGPVLVEWQQQLPDATFSDTASVKVRPLTDAQRLGADLSSMCGAHPVSGRERSGPEAAREDLFRGQPWVITPSAATSARAHAHARLIATACGANVIQLDPEAHDLALGLLSHLPHVVASAVAARLALIPDDVVKLAGPGLMDFTRIAGANADLWTDIVAANASPVASLLADVVTDLIRVRDALWTAPGAEEVDEPVVEALFRLGNTGRLRLETASTAPSGLTATPAPLAVVSSSAVPEQLVVAPSPAVEDPCRPELSTPVPIPSQPGVLTQTRGEVATRAEGQNGDHGSYGHARRELGRPSSVGGEDDGWRL